MPKLPVLSCFSPAGGSPIYIEQRLKDSKQNEIGEMTAEWDDANVGH